MSLCIVCRERPATVPDKNRTTADCIRRVCRECHEKLRDDLHPQRVIVTERRTR
jgi:hypothetical protein